MDDTSPATKADLQQLEAFIREQFKIVAEEFTGIHEQFGFIDERFKGVDQKLESIDEKFKGVNQRFESIDEQFKFVNEQFKEMRQDIKEKFKAAREDSNQILNVLVNVDKRLTAQTKDHEKRITRLEKAMA
ncbi:hypothetical protein HY213_03205 [Candidatus Peregrinibacteria bacterium]|nr:hypothetical protein [Candidatus Peregrinibacteria bacterium]